MTVAAVLTETVYSLVGSTLGPFQTVWPYNAAGDVTVQLDRADGNGPVLLTQGYDYTLTASNPTLSNGGSILLAAHVLTTATWAIGALIALVRITPRSQPSSFGEAVGFSPQASEQALDNVERQVQEQTAKTNRAVMYDYGQAGVVAPATPKALWTNDASGKLTVFQYGNSANLLLATDSAGNLTLVPPPPPDVDVPGGGGGGGGGTVTGGGITLASYAAMRASSFTPSTPGGPIFIVLDDPDKGGVFVPGTGPDNGGTRIVDANSQCWQRVYGGRVDARWFYDCAGHRLGDNSAVAITALDQTNNPQWVGLPAGGAYPVGTYWDYVALQQWVYCLAADGSTPGHVAWNNNIVSKNRAGFCPAGEMWINQSLAIFGTGLDIEFSGRSAVINWNGNNLGASNVGPAVLMDSVSYSRIKGLTISDNLGVSNYLVSIDHSSTSPINLSPQANTFEDWTFYGGWADKDGAVMTQAAVAICPLGGSAAQGDSHTFINLFCVNFIYDGVVLMGNNIVACTFYGGNFQGCLRRGINSQAGSFAAYETITESVGTGYYQAPQQNHILLDGADWYAQPGFGASENNTVVGNRSESIVSVVDLGQHTLLMNSAIVPNATIPPFSTGQHAQIGSIQSVSGAPYSLVLLVDDGGWPWFLSDPTSTTTHVINPGSPGWTTNQWVGYGDWIRFPGGGSCGDSPITASDANSITLSPALGGAGVHNHKIFGKGGASAPNWGAVTHYGRVQRNATGGGFTTTAGSNIVKSGTNAGVGDWVCICGAYDFVQAGHYTTNTALIGKISAIDGSGNATIVDGRGNPVNASHSITDCYGYYGAPISDGQLTWIALDWDVAWGIKRGIGVVLAMGRASACGELLMDGPPTQGRGGNFIEPSGGPGAQYGLTYDFKSAPPVWLATPATGVNTAAYTIPIGGSNGIGSAQTLKLNMTVAAVTVNLPALDQNITDEFDLMLTQGNPSVGAITVTWGTNVLAASPTVALGSVGNKSFVARMKWIGGTVPAAPGSWYVTGLQGPM